VHFGDTREIARPHYRQFVNEAISSEQRPWDKLIGQMFLGSEEWIDGVRTRVALKPRSDDHPRLQREVRLMSMADVVTAVAQTLSADPDVVRRGRGGVPRMVAAWVGCHEAFLTNRQIAAGLRLRSAARVSQLVQECDRALSSNARVQQLVDRSVATLRRKN
jgi:hypothetical protein